MRRLAAVLSLLVLLTGCGGGADDRGEAAKHLPDVTLQPLHSGGQPIDFGSVKGPAVINLWANWCGPCRKELPVYEEFHQANPGVRMIGIDYRDHQPAQAIALAKASGVTYPLVVDDEKFQAVGLPRLLLVDGAGRVAWSGYLEITSVDQLQRLVKKHLG